MIFRFREADSLFHRMDPLSKFIWVLCMSVIAVAHEWVWGQLFLFLTIITVGYGLAQLSMNELWRGLRFPLMFGLPYFLLQLIFLPGDTLLLTIGPLEITKEALTFAAAVSIRLFTLVALSLVFVITTDPRDVVLTLAQKCKVPYRIAFGVAIALRFLPLLEEEAKILRDAMKRRGAIVRSRFIFMIFGSAVQRVHHIALGMEMKGFGAYRDRTYVKTIHISWSGKVLSVASGLSVILCFILM